MFCGCGTMAIKAAVKKKNVKIVCNDSDQTSINYCNKNIVINKV